MMRRAFAVPALAVVTAGAALANEPPRPTEVMVQVHADDEPGGEVRTLHVSREGDERYEMHFSTAFLGVENREVVNGIPLTAAEVDDLHEAVEAWRREHGFAFDRNPRGDREWRTIVRVFWDDEEALGSLPLEDLRRARAYVGPDAEPSAARLIRLAEDLVARGRGEVQGRLAKGRVVTVTGRVGEMGRRVTGHAVHPETDEAVYGWRVVDPRRRFDDLLIRDDEDRRTFIPKEWLLASFHETLPGPEDAVVFRPREPWVAKGRASYFPTRPLGAPADETRTASELWSYLHGDEAPRYRGEGVLSEMAGRLVRLTGRAVRTSERAHAIDVERVELLDPESLRVERGSADVEGLTEQLR